MFNLDLAVTEWRQSYQNSESVAAHDVAELESHLRDQIADLRKRDLNDQEAFFIATSRLGNSAELSREFAKVNVATVWRSRIIWMLGGYVAYSIAGSLFNTAATLASTGMAIAGVSGTATSLVGLGVSCVSWAALLVFAWFQSRKPVASSIRISIGRGLVVGVVMVGGIILQMASQRFRFQLLASEELGEAVVWSTFGGWFIHFCVFVASVAMICQLNEASAQELESASG